MRTVLAATLRVVDAVLRWRTKRDGYVQRPDRQIALHAIARRPTDDAPRTQAECHREIKRALPRP